ncbi:hypothetical protein CapIbe_016242 [Capra ibex]
MAESTWGLESVQWPGDTRSTETPKLAVMHTWLVTELRRLDPRWTGDKLHQEARKIVEAVVRIFAYQHFLPPVLGENRARKALGPSQGCQASAPNPRVPLSSAFFASWQTVYDSDQVPQGQVGVGEEPSLVPGGRASADRLPRTVKIKQVPPRPSVTSLPPPPGLEDF